jgi:HK97 family phage major capsid protein
MSKLTEAEARYAALATEIRGLSERDDLTDDEAARFDAAMVEFDTAETEATSLRAREAVIERARQVPENVEPGDASLSVADRTASSTRTKRNPYDLSEMRSIAREGGESAVRRDLASRARQAIEEAPIYVTDAHRECATKLVETSNHEHQAAFSEHMLRHGSPEYVEAWTQYMTGGLDKVENRAALTTVGANGGFLIPFFLDPTVILNNTGVVNPFRQISRVETIPTNVWHGVSSTGVTAEWTSEASEVADASPVFLQPTVTPVRADAYVQASFEVVADSNVAAQIGALFADAKDRLEGIAFAVGSGSTQPKGIITALSAVTNSRVASQTSGAYGAVDTFALANTLPARWQDNSSWVAHWSTFNRTRQFATGTGPQFAFWADFGPGIPSTLLGRPAYQSSAMTDTTTGIRTASNEEILVLGDFSQFLIVDRIGMEVVYNPLVVGSNRRPTGEVGWAAFWRVGSDVTSVDAFRVLEAASLV